MSCATWTDAVRVWVNCHLAVHGSNGSRVGAGALRGPSVQGVGTLIRVRLQGDPDHTLTRVPPLQDLPSGSAGAPGREEELPSTGATSNNALRFLVAGSKQRLFLRCVRARKSTAAGMTSRENKYEYVPTPANQPNMSATGKHDVT